MKSQRIVLFDIDGTLVRGAGPHHKQALIEATHTITGMRCSLDEIDTSGRLDRDLIAIMLRNAGFRERQVVTAMKQISAAAQQYYVANCKSDLSGKVCPGIHETLDSMARHEIPMGLVTGNFSAIAWRKLENARIAHYFSFGAFAEEATTRARLAKLAYWQAKRKGLAATRSSVTLIGDHANDIAAAQANGFRSVAVATGVMQSAQLSRFKPDLILESLENASLSAILGDLP